MKFFAPLCSWSLLFGLLCLIGFVIGAIHIYRREETVEPEGFQRQMVEIMLLLVAATILILLC